MRKSVYKDILDFLIKVIVVAPRGNHLRRLQVLASLVHGCVQHKNRTLECLSQPCKPYSASKKTSLLQQTKRWMGNKWVDRETFFMPFAAYFLCMAARGGELPLPAVPSGCRVVILGDGEFDGLRLRAWCAGQKWELVLRTACDRQVDCGG